MMFVEARVHSVFLLVRWLPIAPLELDRKYAVSARVRDKDLACPPISLVPAAISPWHPYRLEDASDVQHDFLCVLEAAVTSPLCAWRDPEIMVCFT